MKKCDKNRLGDVLVELEDLGGIRHSLDAHLGGVDEAVLVEANVHEGSKVGYVGDYAGELHSHIKVVYGVDILGEFEFLGGLAGVKAGLEEFLEDVVDCGKAELAVRVVLRFYLRYFLLVANQFSYRNIEVRGHFVHYAVCLRMDGGVVQRVLGVTDAEEAGALLEGLGAKPGHTQQLLA